MRALGQFVTGKPPVVNVRKGSKVSVLVIFSPRSADATTSFANHVLGRLVLP